MKIGENCQQKHYCCVAAFESYCVLNQNERISPVAESVQIILKNQTLGILGCRVIFNLKISAKPTNSFCKVFNMFNYHTHILMSHSSISPILMS